MGAIACCDRETVHNNVDSPNRTKAGKNDPIIVVSPKGTQSLNFESKNLDLIIEKSKNRKKNEDVEKTMDRTSTPVKQPVPTLTESRQSKQNKNSKEDIKRVFNDDEVQASDTEKPRDSQSNRESYYSHRRTSRETLREKLGGDPKTRKFELDALHIDLPEKNKAVNPQIKQVDKQTSNREPPPEKQEDQKQGNDNTLVFKEIESSNLIVLTVGDEIVIPKELEKDFDSPRKTAEEKKEFNEEFKVGTVDSNFFDLSITQNNQHNLLLPNNEPLSLQSSLLPSATLPIEDTNKKENKENSEKNMNEQRNSANYSKTINPSQPTIHENPLGKTIDPTSSGMKNRMMMFEKKNEDKKDVPLQKTNTLSDKKNLFEKKFSVSQPPKEAVNTSGSGASKQQINPSVIKGASMFEQNKEKKEDLSKTSHNPSFSTSPFKDRIKNLENFKPQSQTSTTASPIYVMAKKKSEDKMSEEEEAFLRMRLKNISQVEEENNDEIKTKREIDFKSKTLKPKKSVRINNIAKELEKHLLGTTGMVNPVVENILELDEYVHIMNDKPVSKGKRKMNRQEFN